MARFTNRVVSTNGISLAVRDEGSGPAVVLCHGFPELAYSWRHQIPALVAAGFRALAPDQRGYGDSDRPEDVAAYDIHHLTGDLVGLLDALDIERAVFVGHDWGGLIVWMMPLLHPTRTAGVIGVNTPYLPRAPIPPVTLMRAAFGRQSLHRALPGAGRRRDGARARRAARVQPARAAAACHWRTSRRGSRPAAACRTWSRSVERSGAARRAAALRRRPAGLRRRLHAHRLHGRHQLVSQSRPQLGGDTRARRGAHRRSRP